MSPKKPGANYYEQASPSERGFKSRGFRLHPKHLKLFDQDAAEAGGTSAYLRKLWEEDRLRRGLPPLPKTHDDPSEPSM